MTPATLLPALATSDLYPVEVAFSPLINGRNLASSFSISANDDSADQTEQKVVLASAFIGWYYLWSTLRKDWKKCLKTIPEADPELPKPDPTPEPSPIPPVPEPAPAFFGLASFVYMRRVLGLAYARQA